MKEESALKIQRFTECDDVIIVEKEDMNKILLLKLMNNIAKSLNSESK